MNNQTTIKTLVVIVKTSKDEVREVILPDEVKKEVWEIINKYQITLGVQELNEILKFRK